MARTLVFAAVLCLCAHHSSGLYRDRVKLRDVQALTLRLGQYTTGRRSHPVPQLNCRGGSAGCRHQPSVVQCYNRGTNGRDVQWECKAEMKRSQKFGLIQVTCEGYDYPQDEYILVGSCGLEYYLERTGHGRRSSLAARGQQIYKKHHSSSRRFPSFVSAIFVVLAALGFCALCLCCVSVCDDTSRPGSAVINRLKRSQRRYQPLQAALQSTNQPAACPSVPPPAYQTYERPPPYNPQYMPTGQAPNINYGCAPTMWPASSSGGPGFWTGAATGGLLGYLYGDRGTNAGERHVYTAPVERTFLPASKYGNDAWDNGCSATGGGDESIGVGELSDMVTSTGFGQTDRR